MVDLLEETFIQGEYHGHVVMASYGKALEVTHGSIHGWGTTFGCLTV